MAKVLHFVLVTFITLLVFETKSLGSGDSTLVNRRRLNTVLIGTGAAYGISLVALNQAWYKEQRTSFHFFNDNAQWNQVDKLGHFYSAYQLTRVGKELFLWTNMSEKKSVILSAAISQTFMITIDIFDGFSSEYGFSWGDIAANLAGSGFFLSQELIWKEQKIKPKFSFHTTNYASLRPEVLGGSLPERILKDYNGQTHWLSFDMHALTNQNPKIPTWINLALGYGANEMIHGRENENNAGGFYSYRQYYVGLDFDLSYVKSRSKLINGLLFIVDMIRLPAPAIEYNTQNGIHYHWLFF